MRSISLLAVFLAVSSPSFGQPERATQGEPTAASEAQYDRYEAHWADLEAERRMTDGDYDGALQAHRQAEQDLGEAQRQQTNEQAGH